MAYYGSVLPSVTASTTDVWLSVANALVVPFRDAPIRSRQRAGRHTGAAEATAAQGQTESKFKDAAVVAAKVSARPVLPDFLRNATIELQSSLSTGSPRAGRIEDTVSKMSRSTLAAANPIPKQILPYLWSEPSMAWARSYLRPSVLDAATRTNTATARMFSTRPTILNRGITAVQTRPFGGGLTRRVLALSEEAANGSPGNANLQSAFYQILNRSNMYGITVERYQSGRFASNAACEEAYHDALTAVSRGSGAGNAPRMPMTGNQTSQQPMQHSLPPMAGIQGSAPASYLSGGSGNGSGSPIPVQLTESRGSVLLKWVRFLLSFAVFTYLSLALVTLLTETLLARKGPAGRGDSEVRAEKQTTRFSDVHGCDEAKEELKEVVEFLRDPDRFTDLGAKLPKGVLLVGPPGTGKTLLARAIAGEAGVPFFYMSGSEFDEIYVGVGAKRVRELFQAAKAKSPAIIFIDELDAIGGVRSPKDQAYSKQTLNQLLTELDGFNQDTQIVLIGATNLPQSLDKALTRPGRFDRHVNVELPDVRGRLAILKHHAKKIKLSPDVDLESVAARASGNSGAQLENMLNVAAIRASRARAAVISRQDLDWAYDRVTMGSERRSMVLQEKEKEMTAYHEAGHALVQLLQKEDHLKLYKVTILPKGPSLGHTAFQPEMDKYSYTAADYHARIKVGLGGKMAEELQYGSDRVTSGVSSDLEHATTLAFDMVSRFGMSEVLGPMEFFRRYENLSSETRALVEGEVQKLMKKSYEDVRKLLTDHRVELDRLAKALVQYETLDRAEVEKVIRGEKLLNRPVLPPGPMTVPIPSDGRPVPIPDGGVSVPPSRGSEAPPASPKA